MTQDAHIEAFRRLLTEGAQGGQAKVDALVALVQRTIFVAPWPAGVDGYRTLVNSQRSAALPIFTDRAELENAGRRFGWFAPDGSIPGIEIGARAALTYAKAQGLAYVVVDIAANHCLEVGRDEIEPLLSPNARKQSGPFAASGRISSSLHQTVKPQQGAPSGPAPATSVQMGTAAPAPRVSQPTAKPPAVPAHARMSQPNVGAQSSQPAFHNASRPVMTNVSRPAVPSVPMSSMSVAMNNVGQNSVGQGAASRPVGSQPAMAQPSHSDVRGPTPLTKTGASLPRIQIPAGIAEDLLLIPENPPYAAVLEENDVPTLRTNALVGTALPSVELSPPLSPPSEAILDRLEETFRNYPEIEWACIGSVDKDTAVGLRIDSRMRKRIQEIANEIAVVTAPNAYLSVLLDAPNHLRKARNDSLVFYPWRRKA